MVVSDHGFGYLGANGRPDRAPSQELAEEQAMSEESKRSRGIRGGIAKRSPGRRVLRAVCRGAPVPAVLLAGLAFAEIAATRKAADTNAPQVRPVAVIPLIAKGPVIDGSIGEGEWNTLHVRQFVAKEGDLLEPRHGEFWIGSDGKMLYLAVRSAVHPDGPKADRKPRKGLKDAPLLELDDSIELWIDAAPDDKDGRHFRLLLNTLGAQSDTMFDRKYNSQRQWWRPDTYRHAQKLDKGIWTVELAVALKDLGIEESAQPIGMRVCRNYQQPLDQSRWAPNVAQFSVRETMPRICFRPGAPVVGELGRQDDSGIRIAVELCNPTAKPLPLRVRLGHNPETKPRDYKDWSVTLKPREKRVFEYQKELDSPDNYPAVGEILVTDPEGTRLYHRDFKWHTRPKDPWQTPSDEKSGEAAQ